MPAAQSMVKEVKDKELVLQNGDVLPYGLCVWCERVLVETVLGL